MTQPVATYTACAICWRSIYHEVGEPLRFVCRRHQRNRGHRAMLVLAVGLALAAAGCATTTWVKPGGTAADFESDKAACSFQVSAAADPIFAALHYGDCLRGRGWTAERR